MIKRTFKIYRYDPDKDAKPYMQTIELELAGNERMLRTPCSSSRKWIRRCRSAARAAKACAVPTR